MDPVFKALADPSRRELLDRLFERDGQTLSELTEALRQMTRFGVMKHLRILEDAQLVTSRRLGRARLHYLNAVPIQLIHDRWIGKYRRARAAALADLKLDLEEDMQLDSRPEQVYTVYIRAPRDKVWEAITRPEFTHRYFYGSEPHSDWGAGDRLLWTEHGSGRELVDGEVLECDPPRRLVHTWIVKYDDALTAEGASRVSWELEDAGGGVTKLVAVHDSFPVGSQVYDNVKGGWMLVLSGLKTLLETGTPLQPERVPA